MGYEWDILWLFLTVCDTENCPLMVDLPSKNGDFL